MTHEEIDKMHREAKARELREKNKPLLENGFALGDVIREESEVDHYPGLRKALKKSK